MNREEFNRKIIGENLRKLRLAKGLTVEDVRCYLKLGSVQAIYKYENGVSYPQVDTFLSMLELYEAQIIKCIEGKSKLSEATLARMISRAEDSVAVYEKEIEKARMDKQNQKDTAAQIEDFYKEFKGWADEYESAALERRRVILSQLFSRIEIGRGYEVKVEIAMSYKQFLNLSVCPSRFRGQ